MPETTIDFEARFRFLFPAGARACLREVQPRYKLLAPDILELKWSVWDHDTRTTIGRGELPDQAVDAALATIEAVKKADELRANTEKIAAAAAQTKGAE